MVDADALGTSMAIARTVSVLACNGTVARVSEALADLRVLCMFVPVNPCSMVIILMHRRALPLQAAADCVGEPCRRTIDE